LVDPVTREGAIIDAVNEQFDRDMQYIEELGIELLYVIETHVHADHITSAGRLRKSTGAQIVYSEAAQIKSIDISANHGDELPLGSYIIKVLATPGHTLSCISCYIDGMVFTGDALFIRGCGRTDFQKGNAELLYNSIHQQLFSLPDVTRVFPGHDYNGRTWSTINEEKQFNSRLKLDISQQQFIETMNNLNLALPKKINEAVPANIQCGINVTSDRGILKEFSIDQLYRVWQHRKSNELIIDNRTEEEFATGRVPGSRNIPLGTEDQHIDELQEFEFVYIYCHSGRRAQTAFTHLSILGLDNLICVSHAGMPDWIESGYPVES
jgi:sulfur dioxygenase